VGRRESDQQVLRGRRGETGKQLLEAACRVLGRAASAGVQAPQARSSLHAMEVTPRLFGCQSMTAPLRRVLVRPPAPGSWAAWKPYGWRGEPDATRMEEEHEAFRSLLAEAGAEVVVAATPHSLDPDAIYVYDPALVSDDGAVMLRPGKEGRRGEVEVMAADF